MIIRFFAAALLCLVSTCTMNPAFARGCLETGTVMAPICGMTGLSPAIWETSDGRRVTSIRVKMKRERPHRTSTVRPLKRHVALAMQNEVPSLTAFDDSIARPGRYIAGRLICAVNVGAALAERGIKGTGSALARSYDRWGVRVAQPVPGAVAVTDRRGGGHVAIVSRVEGARVFVWNPSTRGRGWREVEYTGRHARYRIAG
jgi:hypothetical protein